MKIISSLFRQPSDAQGGPRHRLPPVQYMVQDETNVPECLSKWAWQSTWHAYTNNKQSRVKRYGELVCMSFCFILFFMRCVVFLLSGYHVLFKKFNKILMNFFHGMPPRTAESRTGPATYHSRKKLRLYYPQGFGQSNKKTIWLAKYVVWPQHPGWVSVLA